MEVKEWQVRLAVNNVVSNWMFIKYYFSPRYYFQNLLVQEIERVTQKQFSSNPKSEGEDTGSKVENGYE